jgi:glycosyltransferase involved in cell wall biosynthesis
MTTDSAGRPLISCIVPVLNGVRFLGSALDSIFAQSHRPLELIVVDGGSTDGTLDLLAAYPGPLQVLIHAEPGAAAGRNIGLAAAQGQFVAFLDADDLWQPDKLARQLARFAARPELQLSVTMLQNFWIAELAAEAERYREAPFMRPLPGYSTVTLLARREAFERVGPFNPDFRYADGAEWFLRAASLGRACELLPEILVRRRIHDANISRRNTALLQSEFLKIARALVQSQRRADS